MEVMMKYYNYFCATNKFNDIGVFNMRLNTN